MKKLIAAALLLGLLLSLCALLSLQISLLIGTLT